jgi:hypothetical protein
VFCEDAASLGDTSVQLLLLATMMAALGGTLAPSTHRTSRRPSRRSVGCFRQSSHRESRRITRALDRSTLQQPSEVVVWLVTEREW